MNKALLGAILGAFLFPVAAHAETISQALLDCSKESNTLKRLVCYDRLVKDIKQYEDGELPAFSLPNFEVSDSGQNTTTPSASATPRPAPRQEQSVNRDADADFGLARRDEDKDKKVYLTIAKIEKSGRRNVLLTFENGQVWRQTDGESYRLKVGDVVYVERAALGSFVLSKDDIKKRIRVKRER